MNSINRLLAGYDRFRNGYYQQNKEKISDLSIIGQSPKFMLITCCDSRVEPAVIFDCDPGDIFTSFNIANLVHPFNDSSIMLETGAALEYAVTVLKVEHIIIMGHSSCGGIGGLLKLDSEKSNPSIVESWLSPFIDTRNKLIADTDLSDDKNVQKLEQYCIVHSLSNLLSYPFIKEAVDNNNLSTHGWYYDISSSKVSIFNSISKQFSLIN